MTEQIPVDSIRKVLAMTNWQTLADVVLYTTGKPDDAVAIGLMMIAAPLNGTGGCTGKKIVCVPGKMLKLRVMFGAAKKLALPA